MQTLQELIREARRDLRRASGLPLTTEEIEEELRSTQMEAMDRLLVKSWLQNP